MEIFDCIKGPESVLTTIRGDRGLLERLKTELICGNEPVFPLPGFNGLAIAKVGLVLAVGRYFPENQYFERI